MSRYLLALMLINLAACSSMQPVAVPSDGHAADAVEVGSRVELLTVDGATHAFTVTEVDERGVGGEPGFFTYGEIDSLRVKVPAEGSIVLGVVIGIALGVLFWYAVDEAAEATLVPGI